MADDISRYRRPEYPIESLFVRRWSPRAMAGTAVDEASLMRLFEAARWAPSSYNNQPWRFLYARRETPHWEVFFDLLAETNRLWAKDAGALLTILAKETFDNGAPSVTHCLDVGSAWENLALQGTAMGLVVHGMQGFDYARARENLGVPEDYSVLAMAAVGWPGRAEDLPEALRAREYPSDRKPIAEIAFEGPYPP
ncbi:MAG TPA: nitroreductase family protein [Gammaproteobacteria bacterium]|nr:nitroreductase family protein [Gammaproteobacteria bacterium]